MKYNICIEDKSFVSCARNDEKSKTFATGTVRLLFSELPLIMLIRKGLKLCIVLVHMQIKKSVFWVSSTVMILFSKNA